MTQDFTKEFFQRTWGTSGYYEHFSYGVGIQTVYDTCIKPFISQDKYALEIGSGGGSFTEMMIGKFKMLTAVDVIMLPEKFHRYDKFIYIELPQDKLYSLPITNGIEFCFSYNVFCHLSNEALVQYFKSIHRALKTGGDFVFMLSSYGGELGTLLPMGHFAQDDRTIDIITGEGWKIVSRNMIPQHRDIIVHLKKI